MTRMKIGGMVLTGVGAYLIISKGISAVRGMIRDVSEAVKWKAYYNCKRPDPLAPGYERVSDCKVTKDGGTPPKPEKTPSSETLGDAVSDVVRRAVDNLFDRREAQEEAVKDEAAPSEDDEEDEEEKCYVDYSKNPDGELIFVPKTSPDTEEAIPTTNEAEDEENETVG